MMRELRADFKWQYGCILAKSLNWPYEGTENPCNSLLDFWRFRVSEIDPLQLPLTPGHVTVWDDLFSKRGLEDQLLEAFRAQQGMADKFDMALRSYQSLESGESEYRYIHRVAPSA